MTTKTTVVSILAVSVIVLSAFAPPIGKLTSSKTHIKFFSSTVAEDIEAHNYKSVSTLDTETGDVVFSLPMQSFEFEKALMQKHFNSDMFLDTKQFPKAKLVGRITNLAELEFQNDGTYQAQVEGKLTIHGITNPITETATIIVNGTIIKALSELKITLSDYGVTFLEGKPASNIAKTVEVTIEAEYPNLQRIEPK